MWRLKFIHAIYSAAIKYMNILLTGGAGYIGSHTAIALSLVGYKVILFDNFCNSDDSVVARLGRIVGKEVPCIEGDVRDYGALVKALEEHQIDSVIHFAGLKAVGESSKMPLEYYSNNVCGAISLLQAMSSCNIKKLIFSSSATVYGNPQYLPIDENHLTAPTNPYGRNKLQVEELLHDVCNADPKWRIACLRYFNPVGAHESGLIGEDPAGIPNNLMPFIAQVAEGKLSHLNIFGNDYDTRDGTGVRDYIHVMDLAEGHSAALCYLEENTGFEIFNLGTGQGYSVLEMVAAFERANGGMIKSEVGARRPGDIATCFADVRKARKQLHWSANRGLDQMCASLVKWHKG